MSDAARGRPWVPHAHAHAVSCRNHDEWEEQGHCPKDLWRKAGDNGMLCATMPEEYGGAGCDILYSAGKCAAMWIALVLDTTLIVSNMRVLRSDVGGAVVLHVQRARVGASLRDRGPVPAQVRYRGAEAAVR